eukprot:1418471-Amphidinium_carterae.2
MRHKVQKFVLLSQVIVCLSSARGQLVDGNAYPEGCSAKVVTKRGQLRIGQEYRAEPKLF